MNEKCTLDRLENDLDAATVYIAFFEPKYQQKAIELIYHKKNPGVNLQWFYKKRQELEKEGYLTRCDTRLKRSIFKSNIEPIVNTIRKEIKRGGSVLGKEDESTKDTYNALSLVLDSSWFRNFYSQKNLKNPFSHPTYQFLKGYRAENRLQVINVRHLLLSLINEIGNYSYTNHTLMSEYPNFIIEDQDFNPNVQELLCGESFDGYVQKKNPYIPIQVINLFYYHLRSNKGILIERFTQMEMDLFNESILRAFNLQNSEKIDEYALVGLYESILPSVDESRLFFHSIFNEPPIYFPDETHQAFVNDIKKQSALIPISVSDIMRKCYHNSSLAVDERCEKLLIHYRKFYMRVKESH